MDASPVKGTLTIGGPAVQLTNHVPGQQLVWTFPGGAGQPINFEVNNYSALSGNSTVNLYDERGRAYGGTWINNPNLLANAYGPFTLAMGGSYALTLTPDGNATGSATVQVLPVALPLTGTLTIDGPAVGLTNTTPAQQLIWTFTGTAGQQINVSLSSFAGLSPNSTLTLYDEQGRPYDGTWLNNPNLLGNAFGPFTLRATGTYTLALVPSGTALGTATVRVLSMPAPVVGTTTIGGAAVQLTSTAPRQQLVWTFQGMAGQQISVDVTRFASLSGNSMLFLYDEQGHAYDGTWINNPNLFNNAFGPITLNMNGTYSLVLTPDGIAPGSATVQVLPTLSPIAGGVTVNGSAVRLTSTEPGQLLAWTFPCTAGQSVALRIDSYGGLSGNSAIRLFDQLLHAYGNGALNFYSDGTKSTAPIGPFTINVSGSCTAVVTPATLAVGNVLLRVTASNGSAGSSFVQGTLTPGAAGVLLSNKSPGQQLLWTLQGSAGQQIAVVLDRYIKLAGTSTLAFYDQFGHRYGDNIIAALSNQTRAVGRLGPYTLPRTGIYSIVLAPSGSALGGAVVRAVSVPQAVTHTVAVGGSAQPLTNTASGQLLVWTFQGNAGQRINVALDGYAGLDGFSSLAVYDAQHNELGSDRLTFLNAGGIPVKSLGPYVLPRTGTYVVPLVPSGVGTGSAAVRVFNVPQSPSGVLTLGGASVPLTNTAGGQPLVWTLQAIAGQQVAIAVDQYAGLAGFSTLAFYDANGVKYGSDNLVFLNNRGTPVKPFGPFGIPRTGRYSVVLTPSDLSTGTASLRAINLVPVAGALTIGGPAVTLANGIPWQPLVWRFSATQGQRVTVWLPAVSGLAGSSRFGLFDQEGRAYRSDISLNDLGGKKAGVYTLQLTGTYTIRVTPDGTSIGSVTVQVSP